MSGSTPVVETGAPIVTYRADRAYERRQRVLDVAVAATALAVSGPILAVAALAIKIEDGGPIFFVQKRIGRFGRPFAIYKLRTMRSAACIDALSPSASSDARITRVGKWLRKFSIDELPQFINVLKGDMAVVGPRPEMPFIVQRYEKWQHVRHLVKPGITGLWQTTVRSHIPLYEPAATRIDIDYIKRASTRMDGKLVLATFGVLTSTAGAF